MEFTTEVNVKAIADTFTGYDANGRIYVLSIWLPLILINHVSGLLSRKLQISYFWWVPVCQFSQIRNLK